MMTNLEFGAAFSRVFDLYGRYAAKLLTYAAIFYVGITVVWVASVGLLLGNAAIGALAGLVGFVITTVASMVLTGMYVIGLHEVERGGEFPTFGEAWPRVAPRIGALLGTSLLVGLGVLLGMVLLVVPGLVLLTWWAVIAPVVMLEERSGRSALARSRELVRGHGWTVFGLIIVTNVIVGLASSTIGAVVGNLLGGSDELLGQAGRQFVSGTLTAPISALLAIVMYEALTGTGETPGGPGPGATGATGMSPQLGDPATPPPTPPPATPDEGRSGPFV